VERHRCLLSAEEESSSHQLTKYSETEMEGGAVEERLAAYQRGNINQEGTH